MHALVHAAAASTLVIVALRPLQRVEAKCAPRKTALKLLHAICKVAAQTAEMETGQHGAIGVPVLTPVEVALAGGHERSKQRQTNAVSQQLGFHRNTSSATRRFLVPKIPTAPSAIGVHGVIALALVMG